MLALRGRAAGDRPGLPARGRGVRRLGLPLPPGHMPLWRRGSVLKRWRYVGVYTREVMLCVGHAHIGPIPRWWWAIAEPDGTLHGDSSTGRGGMTLDGPSVRVDAPGARIDLDLEETELVETASPVGQRGNYIWTGKGAGVMTRGVVVIRGKEHRMLGAVTFAADLSRCPSQREGASASPSGAHARSTGTCCCAPPTGSRSAPSRASCRGMYGSSKGTA